MSIPELELSIPRLTGAIGYRAAVLASEPVGYWPLDEPAGSTMAHDVSGGGRNATSFAGATFGVSGPFSDATAMRAISAPGSSGGARVESFAQSFRPASYEFWARALGPEQNGSAMSLTQVAPAEVIAQFNVYIPTRYWLEAYGSNWRNSATFPPGSEWQQWAHMVLTADLDTQVRWFYNGEAVTNTLPGNWPGNQHPTAGYLTSAYLGIGSVLRAPVGNPQSAFIGDIAHVAFYDRVLSPQEIADHYEAGTVPEPIPATISVTMPQLPPLTNSFTARVVDSAGAEDTADLSITIEP